MGLFGNKEEKKTEQDILASVSYEDLSTVTLIKNRYQSGVNYLRSQGFYDKWPEYDRFWNSEQWPQSTAKTKNYPRPVTNHFASIIEQKIAGITYDMPEIYYDPIETEVLGPVRMYQQDSQGKELEPTDLDAAEALSHVAEDQWEKLEMDDLVDNACRSAAVLGPGILHFPWDNSVMGGGQESLYIGDIQGYEVDPADFFPGNPYDSGIQTQPYVLMAERVPLSTARDIYKKYAPDIVGLLKAENKSSDREIYDQQHIELDQTDYVDLIHCWEKVPLEGKDPTPSEEVALRNEELESEEEESYEMQQEEEMLKAVGVTQHRLEYTVICQNFVLRKEESLYEHGLYPFAAFQWYPKRYSFHGKPESADLINNQKEENRLAGISLVSAYQTGLPNMRYKEGFVDKTQIPQGPGGGVIPDNSPPGQWGIDFMNPPTPAAHIPQLRQTIVEGMKDSTGVHEAWSGKSQGSQLNASAIIALQEAAGMRIRGIQRRLRKMIREAGLIWLAHWKEFMEEDRFIRVTGESKVKGHIWFRGTAYKDVEFDVRAQSGNASPFSKSLQVAQLDKMIERQIITGEEYLECVPREIFPQAEKILRHRFEREEVARKMELEQKGALVTQMVNQFVESAKANGVEITPEALQGMLQMVDAIAAKSMQEMEEEAATGQPAAPASTGGGTGGEELVEKRRGESQDLFSGPSV